MFGVLSNCIICTFSSAIRQKFTALHTSIYCLTIVPNPPAPHNTMGMPATMPIVHSPSPIAHPSTANGFVSVSMSVSPARLCPVMSWRRNELSYEWWVLLATDWMRFSTAIRLFFSYFSLFFFLGRIPSANFNKISKTHPSSDELASRYVRIHPLTPIRVKNNVFNIDKREKCENNNRKFLLIITARPKTVTETTTGTKLNLPKNIWTKSNHNYGSTLTHPLSFLFLAALVWITIK